MIRLNPPLSCAFIKTNYQRFEGLDANFRNVLNLYSSINGHILSQNRTINAIDKKISIFFPNTNDGKT